MKIIYNNLIPVKGFRAMTIFNIIFARKGSVIDKTVMTHEKIHWEQEKEMMIIGFYLWYVIEFLIKLAYYRNWKRAYRSISFEREAFANEMIDDYVINRKHFKWIDYVKLTIPD